MVRRARDQNLFPRSQGGYVRWRECSRVRSMPIWRPRSLRVWYTPDIFYSSVYCDLNTLLSHISTTAIYQVNRPPFHAILLRFAPNPCRQSCTAKHGLPWTSIKLGFPFQLRPPSLNLLLGVSWNTSAYRYCRSSLSRRMTSCTRANIKTRPSGSRRAQSVGTVIFEAVLSHGFLSSPVFPKFQTPNIYSRDSVIIHLLWVQLHSIESLLLQLYSGCSNLDHVSEVLDHLNDPLLIP